MPGAEITRKPSRTYPLPDLAPVSALAFLRLHFPLTCVSALLRPPRDDGFGRAWGQVWRRAKSGLEPP